METQEFYQEEVMSFVSLDNPTYDDSDVAQRNINQRYYSREHFNSDKFGKGAFRMF